MKAGAAAKASAGVSSGGDLQHVRVTSKERAREVGQHALSAVHYGRTHAANLRMGPGGDLSLLREHVGADGVHHVRLQQTHQGVKVWGADVVVHVSNEHVHGMSGNVAPELPAMRTLPSLAQGEAVTIAKRAHFGAATVVTSRESQELVVWLDKAQAPHLAWHVTFFNEKQGDVLPALWNALVDAHDGTVLRSWNAIDTFASDASGIAEASGVSGNPKFTHTWTKFLDVTPSGSDFQMDTPTQQTLDLANSSFGGSVVTGPLDSIGDAPINDAHGYGKIALAMIKDWQGFDSIDGQGFKLVSRVHYSNNYENAFWDGQEMTYGDGASRFYPLSGSLDVCAHEIDHGFTQFHSALGSGSQSAGLNESFSDIAGMTATFYFFPDKADFNLGENVYKKTGAIRYMCDPPKDGKSIDNAGDFTDGMDPHLAGGPQNKAFCLATRRFASGRSDGTATQASVKRVSNAWYQANAHYWTSSTGYQEACQGVVDAAKAAGFTATEVGYLEQSWADVGVTCSAAAQ